jgi:argininosuccinate lyase
VSDVPDGYLGATGRIAAGPAPELVAAGYERELADNDLLSEGMGLADLAHVLSLGEQGVLPADQERALLAALLDLRGRDPATLADARYGDLYNLRERWLEQQIGGAGGWLAAGRPRREAGRIAFRIGLRALVLDLEAAVARLAAALVEQAGRHVATLMPDFTYLQVAQPTTAGHWLLSYAAPALRDGDRLRSDFAWVNASPAGAGGVNGSRVPVDRERLALDLGFDAVITHTRDAMWQADGLVELVAHAALAATTASRLAEDLEIYASEPFGFVALAAEHCRASALMPQKRNPYALPVIRGAAGTLIGRAAGLAATQRTPSGRTDNLLYAYSDCAESVTLAAGAVDLAAAVVERFELDVAALARPLQEGFAAAADLAEAVMLETGLDHRACYRVVGRAVAVAIERGEGPAALDAQALARAAQDVLGRELTVPAALVAEALDPRAAIATRTVTGGAAEAPMAAMLDADRARAADLAASVARRRAALAAAEEALLGRARARSGIGGGGQRPADFLSPANHHGASERN